jgi:hypothetical protein
MICLPRLLVEARTWVKKLKKCDVHEEEKEDDGAHINNLVELVFLKKNILPDVFNVEKR